MAGSMINAKNFYLERDVQVLSQNKRNCLILIVPKQNHLCGEL